MSPTQSIKEKQLRQLEAEIAAIEAQMLQMEHDKRQDEVEQVQEERKGRSIRRMSAVQTKHSERLAMAREQAAVEDETEYDEEHYMDDPTTSSYNNYYEEVIEEIIEEEIVDEETLYAVEHIQGGGEHACGVAASPVMATSRGGLFAELTAKAADKQSSLHEVSSISDRADIICLVDPTRPATTSAAARPSSAGAGLFGDMMAAIGQRNQRIETGQLHQQNVAQIVAPKPSKPTGIDLAAMVANAATERELRLALGGEKRMKQVVIKEQDEYKMDFKNVAIEAAELGRLTRLNEHVVEGIAVERKAVKDAWESKGLMAIEWRTNHMAIIHEAAALGNQTKMREYVTANFEDEEDEDDFLVDEATQYKRMRALAQAEGASKVEHFIALQKMLDAEDGTRGIVRPMYMYNDITKVVLPKGRLPKWDQTIGQEEIKRMANPLTEISNDVIKKAIDRLQRLKDQEAEPRMRTVCNCGYCDTASPYQTFAYRVVEGRVKGVHIPKELQHELGASDGKKYKVKGKGGALRVTRAIKADATGEIDKEQHFYTKMREKAAREERERIERAKPRVKRGRVTRDGASAPAKVPARGGGSAAGHYLSNEPLNCAQKPAASHESPPSDRERVEAETAATEKEIERQLLEADIKSMEDAIYQQQQAQRAAFLPDPNSVDPLTSAPLTTDAAGNLSHSCIPSQNDVSTAVSGSDKKKGLMGRMFGRKK
ncbi:hypothetical protein MPSEU_001008500 [Mayamaea pseudoterrestris]|nr:hypothetical protein MPSEU_001008500 [Mayamaea pseudoterrestris]